MYLNYECKYETFKSPIQCVIVSVEMFNDFIVKYLLLLYNKLKSLHQLSASGVLKILCCAIFRHPCLRKLVAIDLDVKMLIQ